MSIHPVDEPKFHKMTCRRVRVEDKTISRWMVKLIKVTAVCMALAAKGAIVGLIYAETKSWWSVAFSGFAFFAGWWIYREIKGRGMRGLYVA
jgi:uncharacterized membrane protein